jgi:hypothetical protein
MPTQQFDQLYYDKNKLFAMKLLTEQKRPDKSKQNKHSETQTSNQQEGTQQIPIRKYKTTENQRGNQERTT